MQISRLRPAFGLFMGGVFGLSCPINFSLQAHRARERDRRDGQLAGKRVRS